MPVAIPQTGAAPPPLSQEQLREILVADGRSHAMAGRCSAVVQNIRSNLDEAEKAADDALETSKEVMRLARELVAFLQTPPPIKDTFPALEARLEKSRRELKASIDLRLDNLSNLAEKIGMLLQPREEERRLSPITPLPSDTQAEGLTHSKNHQTEGKEALSPSFAPPKSLFERICDRLKSFVQWVKGAFSC